MFMMLYTALWLLSALALLVFGFLAGRFARKLPVIDDALPWTLHRGEILPSRAHTEESSAHFSGAPTWPRIGD